MRRIAFGLAWAIGIFLIIRAIAEPFVIDLSDPASFRNDWGGPGAIGVLAVHMLPGALAAVLMTLVVRGRRSASE